MQQQLGFGLPQKIKIVGDKVHRWMGGQGKDQRIVVLGCLASLGDSEASIPAQDKDGHMGMIRGRCGDDD